MKTVDKGIPVPTGTPGRQGKYPWREMAVGDSFLADVKSTPSISQGLRVAKTITGFSFLARKTPDGVRVWRIA